MQRLGKVLHVTPSQNIVVKTEKLPKLGSIVINEKLETIGKIFDVIGPTSSPYVIVKPSTKKSDVQTNNQLYVLLSKK